jgi:hypothetical protein
VYGLHSSSGVPNEHNLVATASVCVFRRNSVGSPTEVSFVTEEGHDPGPILPSLYQAPFFSELLPLKYRQQVPPKRGQHSVHPHPDP